MLDARSYCNQQGRDGNRIIILKWNALQKARVYHERSIIRGYVEAAPLSLNGERLLFVHNPKAAGTAIYYALFGHRGSPLIPAWKLQVWCGSNNIPYRLFSIFRDPVERLYSAYKYLKVKLENDDLPRYLRPLLKVGNWEEFVDSALDEKLIFSEPHLYPQSYYLCNIENEILVKDVFRFSSVAEEFSEFWLNHTGRKVFLQKINAGPKVNLQEKSASQLEEKLLDKVRLLYRSDYIIKKRLR